MNNVLKLGAAYVRGYVNNNGGDLNETLLRLPLEQLTENQLGEIIQYGKQADLKMYYFKEKEDLPRVKMVLGFLKAVYPTNLLDVGSGRGVFLFPFMREFPYTQVTSLDILSHRVEFLKKIHDGGIDRLNALQKNICDWSAPDDSFDVVTLLEVLEHIPDVKRAVQNAVRIAKRYIVVTVPSKEDNNPEHIHLLTKNILTSIFHDCGVTNLKFGGVNGHLFLVAAKG